MAPLSRTVLLCLLLSACAGTQTAGKLAYGDLAQAAYADAMEDFLDEDCLVAEPAFVSVRRKFPYSRFAALAELRVADCQFQMSNYPEAAQGYQQFIRYRPSHDEVPYARFQTAKAKFKQAPSDWLLSPPAHERDQRFTQESIRLFRRFILDFPAHPLVGPAQEMVGRAINTLAAHEFYVANFYWEREAPEAAIGRLHTLLRSYGGSGFESKALRLLGDSYLALNDTKQAQAAYRELVERFPKSEESLQARAWLGSH